MLFIFVLEFAEAVLNAGREVGLDVNAAKLIYVHALSPY
jgi:hypothetical protein